MSRPGIHILRIRDAPVCGGRVKLSMHDIHALNVHKSKGRQPSKGNQFGLGFALPKPAPGAGGEQLAPSSARTFLSRSCTGGYGPS